MTRAICRGCSVVAVWQREHPPPPTQHTLSHPPCPLPMQGGVEPWVWMNVGLEQKKYHVSEC